MKKTQKPQYDLKREKMPFLAGQWLKINVFSILFKWLFFVRDLKVFKIFPLILNHCAQTNGENLCNQNTRFKNWCIVYVAIHFILFLGLLINYCSVKYFINFRPKECFFKRVCISETFKFITDVVYINLVEKCYYTNLRVVGIL